MNIIISIQRGFSNACHLMGICHTHSMIFLWVCVEYICCCHRQGPANLFGMTTTMSGLSLFLAGPIFFLYDKDLNRCILQHMTKSYESLHRYQMTRRWELVYTKPLNLTSRDWTVKLQNMKGWNVSRWCWPDRAGNNKVRNTLLYCADGVSGLSQTWG